MARPVFGYIYSYNRGYFIKKGRKIRFVPPMSMERRHAALACAHRPNRFPRDPRPDELEIPPSSRNESVNAMSNFLPTVVSLVSQFLYVTEALSKLKVNNMGSYK